MRKKHVFLLVIIILGLLLRVHHLDKESLWVDESYSIVHAQQATIPEITSSVTAIEGLPPGYPIFLHYWVKLFGDSTFSLRLPSLIFGILAIILIFKLAQLLFNDKVALLSSFFLATSMLQILYSQEARVYSLFTLLTLLSAYCFAKWYKNDNKQYLILYAITILLSIYINYLTIVPVFIYTFLLLLPKKIPYKLLRQWATTHFILALLSLPLLGLIKLQYSLINTGLASSLIKKGLPQFLAKLGIFFYAVPSMIILSLLILFLIFKGRIMQLIKKSKLNDYVFTILLIIGGIFYIYAVLKPFSLFGVPVLKQPITHSYFLIRHSFFLVPIIYLYLAYKIINLKKLTTFCIVFILLINVFSLTIYYQTTTKAEWQEAMNFIGENDLILVDKGGKSHDFLIDYYSSEQNPVLKLTSGKRTRQGRISNNLKPEQLFSVLEDYDDFWLILASNSDDDYKILLSRYQQDFSKEFYRMEIYHYTNRLEQH